MGISIQSKSPLILTENRVYKVISGQVDVFITRVDDKNLPVGKRFHIYSGMKDEIVLSTKLSGYALLISGLFGTEIEELTNLKSFDEHSLNRFIDNLSYDFSATGFETAVIKESSLVKQGTYFKLNKRYLATITGKATIFGVELPKQIVCSSAIIYAESDLNIELSDKLDLPTLYASLGYYLKAHLNRINIEEKNSTIKFAKKLEQSKNFMINSIDKLLTVLNRTTETLFPNEEPHLAAVMVIGHNLDMKIVKPKFLDQNYLIDPLKEIARVSKFMIRDVRLDGDWWKIDAGPIFAFMDVPVALIYSNGAYKAVNPTAKTSIVVDDKVAAEIAPAAYMIYKPFPNKVLTLWDILDFSMTPSVKRDSLMITIMGGLMGIMGMFTPYVTGIIFNSVIPSAEYNSLYYIAFFLICISVTNSIFSITRSIASMRFEGKVSYMLQSAIWSRLLMLPVPFFNQFNSSDLSSRANSIMEIQKLLTGAAIGTILSAVFSLFQFGLLFKYSTQLALIAILLTIIPVAVIFIAGKMRLKIVEESIESGTSLSNTVMQILTGISKFKIIGGERRAFSLWSDKMYAQNNVENKSAKLGNYSMTFNGIYPILTTMIVFYFVATSDNMSVGDYLAFQGAFGSFLGSLMGLASLAVNMLRIIPLYQRAKPILEAIPEVTEQKKDPGNLKGGIKVSNVSYRYIPEGKDILNNISLEITPGEFVAFVGESGSGKTTLLRLLIGFDKPRDGSIYYDDNNMEDLDIQLTRRQMGVVLQRGKLMPGDIYNNIIGPYNLTMQDAWIAAQSAGFDEDIKDMPMGMHTVVGEGTLSGGQKQRVLIARSLVNKPKMIFFDEATSALDNKTQGIVFESLSKLDATKIVIAHRLSTITHANKIYVFKDGSIVESGTYEELLAKNGIFTEFVKRQTV